MAMSVSNIHPLQPGSSVGRPLDQVLSKEQAVVHTVAFPIVIKGGPKGSTCLPSANYFHPIADISMFLRSLPDALAMLFSSSWNLDGSGLIGLTSLLYIPIGLAWAYDAWKRKVYTQVAENLSLAAASIALAIDRGFTIAKEAAQLLQDPLILSSAAMKVQAIANYVSAGLMAFYYAFCAWRFIQVLRGISLGDKLRKQILSSQNPQVAYERVVQWRLYHEKTPQDYRKLALEAGADFLEKLEKEYKAREEEFPWESNSESRKEHAEKLFLTNPLWMMGEMGETVNFRNYTPEGRIVAFGTFIAEKQLRAKIEAGLETELGPDAVAAAKKNDVAELKKALESVNWTEWGVRTKTAIKLALAVIGIAAMIGGGFALGFGIPVGVIILLFAIGGLAWIPVSDFSAFKAQLESGEIRKRDYVMITISLLLSAVAVAGYITLAVMTGGISVYVSLGLASLWLLVNSVAAGRLIDRRFFRPWEYQKVVTAEVFDKFLETEPSQEKFKEILAKMSVYDREGLIHSSEETWQEASKVWLRHLAVLKERSFKQFQKEMEIAAEVRRYHLMSI